MAEREAISVPEDMGMTPNQVAEAYRASLTEHHMSFSEAFKIYRKALFWSAVMCLVSRC